MVLYVKARHCCLLNQSDEGSMELLIGWHWWLNMGLDERWVYIVILQNKTMVSLDLFCTEYILVKLNSLRQDI